MAETDRKLDYRDPEWLAEQLGVDKSTIYRYLQEGTLPGLQLGRKWLVSERQVVDFLDAEARRQTEIRRKGMTPNRDRFDKFTEKARRALNYAQEEAISFQHNYIGTEHLLLGVVRVTDGIAAVALTSLGVEPEKVRSAVLHIIGRGQGPAEAGEIGLTPRAKQCLSLAVEEAKRLNHSYVGTEHIVVGLLLEGGGIASSILGSVGVKLEDVRREVTRLLAEGGHPGALETIGQSGPAEKTEDAS